MKELRIMQDGNWAYLYTIKGKEAYYPIGVLVDQKECRVTRRQLLGRLTNMCTARYSNFDTTGDCLTKSFKQGRPGESKLGDFNLLNDLWR